MKKSAFTILEITVICVIIGILVAFGIPYFINVMEKSRAQACATNLKALQKAVDIYIQENDVVPATLAALPQENIDKAFAELMREKGAWKRRIAFFIQDIGEHGLVYAATMAYFPKVRCPKASPDIAVTYGLILPSGVTTGAQYAALSDTTAIIADTDGSTPALRHQYRLGFTSGFNNVMMAVTKGGDAGCYNSAAPWGPPNTCFGIPCANCVN